jgi:hypothetical protein
MRKSHQKTNIPRFCQRLEHLAGRRGVTRIITQLETLCRQAGNTKGEVTRNVLSLLMALTTFQGQIRNVTNPITKTHENEKTVHPDEGTDVYDNPENSESKYWDPTWITGL